MQKHHRTAKLMAEDLGLSDVRIVNARKHGHPSLLASRLGKLIKLSLSNSPSDGRWVQYLKTNIRRAIREIEAKQEIENAD